MRDKLLDNIKLGQPEDSDPSTEEHEFRVVVYGWAWLRSF